MFNLNKQQLIFRGWTPEKCRERMRGCLKGIKEAKEINGPAIKTYRVLFISLYRNYKRDLFVLLGK